MNRTLLLFLVVIAVAARAQNNSHRDSLSDRSNWQESIYVHTDRELYLTGELAWFKIYLVNKSDRRKSNISAVAYLELLDAEGQAVIQDKILITDGHGDGSLFLSPSIRTGYYQLRCYTNWMKNFSVSSFFTKELAIVNTFKSRIPEMIPERVVTTAQFFPEGGTLVQGIETKVAFQVSDQFDKGIPCSGTIVSASGDTISRFVSNPFGIGAFIFTPGGGSYRVVIRNGNGKPRTFPLPGSSSSGITMSVTSQNEKLKIAARSTVSSHLFAEVVQPLKILRRELKEGMAEFAQTELADGVAQVRIVDEGKSVLCSRLVLKKTSSSISIGGLQGNYGTRDKVSMRLASDNAAHLSIAVTKVDSIGGPYELYSAGYLMLAGVLDKTIDNPDYYLAEEQVADLDALLLTQTCSILTDKGANASFLPEKQGLLLQLNVTPESKASRFFVSILGKYQSIYFNSIREGIVSFEIGKAWGSKHLIAGSWGDSITKMKVIPPFVKAANHLPHQPLALDTNKYRQLVHRNVSMQVQNIYHESELFQPTPIGNKNVPFFGSPDETYNLDDYTRFPSMEEVLREFVKGVAVRKSKGHYQLYVEKIYSKRPSQRTPLILVDNVPVTSSDDVIAFDVLKVKRIEVVTKEYKIGDLSFDGIIALTTYEGEMEGFPLGRSYSKLNWDGFQIKRRWYQPDHALQPEARTPDFRYLLYWNPDVRVVKNENFETSFYTSDVVGRYRVVVEGVSDDGAPIRSVQYFDVKQK